MKYIILLLLVLTSCNSNVKNISLDSWVGKYKFEEESVKAIADYSMVMIWDLTIVKENKSYLAYLEVNGQQTSIKLKASVFGDSSRIQLKFVENMDNSNEKFRKGQVLFELIKTDSLLITNWKTMTHRLKENPQLRQNSFNKYSG